MEDAYELAKCLTESPDDFGTALQKYNAARFSRVENLHELSKSVANAAMNNRFRWSSVAVRETLVCDMWITWFFFA